MKIYKVWYKLEPTFHTDPNINKGNIYDTHIFLKGVEAENLEDAYMKMQADVWSPMGEGRDLVRSKGLRHTSMSVGDILIDEAEVCWEVAAEGFNKITPTL